MSRFPTWTQKNCLALFLAGLTGFSAQLSAETVVFSETFGVVDGQSPPSASCNPDFPAGWTRYNLDVFTPSETNNWVNDAWVVNGSSFFAEGECVAYSTSWYDPVGTADDWLVTPPIQVPANPRMRFRTRAAEAGYQDGYEVRWGVNNSVAALSANPPLLSVNAETTEWNHREIDLSDLAGQTVYFAFRNNSVDKNLLMLDDVQVVHLADHDGEITSVLRPHAQLLRVPAEQDPSIQLGVTVRNAGLYAITNVVVTASVKLDGNEIHQVVSTALPNLAASEITDVSLPSYSVNTPGVITVDYRVAIDEADEVSANDTMSSGSVTLTEREIAADDGIFERNLGLGSEGLLGIQYPLTQPAWVSTIRYYASGTNPDLAGVSVVGEVRAMDMVSGKPGDLIATTQPYVVPDPPVAGFVDLKLESPVLLAAGNYYFGLIEPAHATGLSGTLDLGFSKVLYQPGRNWFKGATPGEDWSLIEAANDTNDLAMMLRVLLAASVADLSAVNASPARVSPRENFTYTLDISNAGPDTAEDVRADITLPADAAFVSATGTGWSCNQAAGVLTCTRPTLVTGTAPPISVTLTAPAFTTSLLTETTVSSSSANPGGIMHVSASTLVTSAALIQAQKTVQGNQRAFGVVTYTTVLSNNGLTSQQDNLGHEFTDTLPPELSLISATATSGIIDATPANNRVTWDGAIPAGNSVTLEVQARIAAGTPAGTSIASQASIAFDADGDNINESTGVSDDPTLPGDSDATVFDVMAGSVTTFSEGGFQADFSGGGSLCTFAHAQMIPASSVSAPLGIQLLADLFDFRLNQCDTTPVTLTLQYPHTLKSGAHYWKYDSTTQNWAVFDNAQIHANTVVLTIQDGGAGDDDGVVNGQIVDPGAPGAPIQGTATAIPIMSPWLIVALATLLGGVGSMLLHTPGNTRISSRPYLGKQS